jgi:3-isopropylmalate/(R)-2-methylmalate dehydratase small subunit
MHKFMTLRAKAAALPMANVDTDMIIPKQFLKTIERSGLAKGLFYELRHHPDGRLKPGFVLDDPAFRDAKILVTGRNFGCGSSREHAPWALMDAGIRCLIAPSFADIFYSNCLKNGLLPIGLPDDAVERLMADAKAKANLSIDLAGQTIKRPNGETIAFEIDSFHKRCLLEGLDDIGLTLEKAEAISAFERSQQQAQPWLYGRANRA